MRISDWSSDVCSSDLSTSAGRAIPMVSAIATSIAPAAAIRRAIATTLSGSTGPSKGQPKATAIVACAGRRRSEQKRSTARSEEHTSELQSLMRISYDVFCVKKKKKKHKCAYKKGRTHNQNPHTQGII